MESPQDKYIREHSSKPNEALDWLQKQTNILTNYPRMLSGAVQGEFLKLMVEISGAANILEIGCFTGYSAICLASGLKEVGRVDTLEINDELEALCLEAWTRAGLQDKIQLHIGNALDYLERFAKEGRQYDLVYIDANKREYPLYLKAVKSLIHSGSIILADDVMLGGKPEELPSRPDKQTAGLLEFNSAVVSDPELEVVMLPLRDGLSLIRKL